MAAELMAPTDKLTGIPFSMLPPETYRTDPNHQIFHSDEPDLQDDGGLAVRHGRVQEVDICDHVVFHQRYGWIKYPTTSQGRLEYLAFITAGYIPPWAIDVRRKKPWVRRLESDEMERLAAGEVRIGSNALLGKFFAEYALEQDLGNISALDEFFNTGSIARRRKLSGWIITEALAQGIEPMKGRFKEAKTVGYISIKNFDRLPYAMAAKVGALHKERFMSKLISTHDKQAYLAESPPVELIAA